MVLTNLALVCGPTQRRPSPKDLTAKLDYSEKAGYTSTQYEWERDPQVLKGPIPAIWLSHRNRLGPGNQAGPQDHKVKGNKKI